MRGAVLIYILASGMLFGQIPELIQNGDFAEAERQLTIALAASPNDAKLHNLQGVLAAQRGEYEKAERSFLQVLRLVPGAVPVQMNLGRLYVEHVESDSDAAEKGIRVYRDVLKEQPANAEARYQLAFLLMRNQRAQESLDELNVLDAASKAMPQALAVALADHVLLGSIERSRSLLSQMLESPDFTEADATLASWAIERARHFDLGIALGEGAVSKLGPSAELLIGLARMAYGKEDRKQTLSYLAHARDLAPENAAIHFFFGIVALEMEIPLEATASLKEAVRLAPDNPYFRYALGAMLSVGRDAELAIPQFEAYCELKPDDPRGRFGLGSAYLESNQYQKAFEVLSPLVNEPLTRIGAHLMLGRVAKAQNRLEDAERELQESLRLLPEQPDALAELGHVYFRMRRYAEAQERFDGALRLQPEHYEANLWLLALYQRTRDSRKDALAKKVELLREKRAEKVASLWKTIEVKPF